MGDCIMVTTRTTGGKADSFRTSFAGYLADFGTTITLRSITTQEDSMGRMTANTPTTSTISADIQFINKSDLGHINSGEAQIGDGMIFVKYNETINLEDELDYDGVRWRIVEEIEGEQVQGQKTYRGFLIRKNVQA